MENIKKRLAFMWLFVFAVYLPFFVFMVTRHNVSAISMSVIGWTSGGVRYLAAYIILTLPFCLYQLFFFNRRFAGNSKFTRVMGIVSCIMITAGAFVPVHRHGRLFDFAHIFLSVTGAVMLMLTILIALVRYALRKKTHKIAALSLCGIYAAALLAAFYVLYTAALFQLLSSLSFFLVLLVVNTVLAVTPKTAAPAEPGA